MQQAVARLPWSHIVILLDKLKEPGARNEYAAQSIEHGWSRNVLAMQIDTHAYSGAGAAITHFDARLPPPQSDLAREALKDPYVVPRYAVATGARAPRTATPVFDGGDQPFSCDSTLRTIRATGLLSAEAGANLIWANVTAAKATTTSAADAAMRGMYFTGTSF